MTRRATHKGHCQLCGRQQKLPKGLLAQHGYTTQWGFFAGVCPGSKHHPYEKSADLIAAVIDKTSQTVAKLRDQSQAWRNPAHDMIAIDHYVPADWRSRGSRREWRLVPRRDANIEPGIRVTYTHQGERITAPISCTHKTDVDLNAAYATHLDRTAEQYERYLQWLAERLAAWTLSALEPVDRVSVADNV